VLEYWGSFISYCNIHAPGFREDIDMEAKTAIVSPLRRFNEEKYYGICELG